MTIYQEGPRNAKIVLVGDAPGSTELKLGRPFVGYSGELLDRMLGRAGIRRADVFITNVCHVQPPKNEFNWFSRTAIGKQHLTMGLLQLKADLEAIKPNVIGALGAWPLRLLTNKKNISDWRGSILPCALVNGLKVVGTYHPAAIMKTYEYKTVAEFDLKRIAEEARFPEIVRPRRELILDPPVEALWALLPDLLNAEWLAVDIECTQRDDKSWRLSCVGFSDRSDRAITVPVDSASKIAFIREVLASPVKKVMQNGMFDTTVLRDEGYEVNNFAWDTMYGHHALYAECAAGADEISSLQKKKRSAAIQKGLAFQTSIYTREPRYKDDGKLWKDTGDLLMFWRYNALDAVVTREIRDVQEKALREFGNIRTLEHSMRLVEPLLSMTRRGIKVDMNKRQELKLKFEEEINRLQAFLDLGAGRHINVSSPDVKDLVYNQLKLPVKTNKKTGRPTADKDAIVALSEKYPNPLLMTIIKIRQKRKLLETYIDTAIDLDGRMRCSFDVTGTRSGRLASRASIYGSGTNMQNQPPEVREMFIADDGMALIYRDFSQAEARVVAALADDAYLLELFADPARDVHKETAARIFGVPIDEVTPEMRYLGKRVRHAVNYGMDAGRFVEVVNEDAEITGIRINLATARKVIEGFWLLHPNHKSVYWANVEREIRYSRTLTNAFGRKRVFLGRMDDKLLREGYSYIPQSTIGWLCNEALCNIYEEIVLGRPDLKTELLLQVHDSILVQCPVGHVREVNELMGKAMDIPFECNGHLVRIPTDSKVGYNWGERSKDGKTNPAGLRDISLWEAACARNS